jgi:ferrous iron transport protein B
VDAKYAFVQGALAETYEPYKGKKSRRTITDKIDALVTHRWAAFPLFFLILYVVFDGTFVIGEYPMQWIESIVSHIGAFVSSIMADGWLKDMIVDGVIGGVGSVLVFLPNILLLYFFISLLEDSGYMARAAFIMDRLMHKIGLHGKSFIPMIMGFGCNVPAIMATRTIESRKSRLITTLIIPFMSCAGRMPVYILIAGAFFPKHAGLVLLGMYALGILVAIVAAKIFSHFFKEDDLPFVMELPPYRVPTAKSIFRHTWEKGKQYLQKMSGIILICSMVIWFLGYFPNHDKYDTAQQQQEHSFIGYVGKAMEPALKPLGFDWKMGVGIVAGVGAKELVVSTLGVMYADDEPLHETAAVSSESANEDNHHSEETRLQRALLKAVTPAGALAYMVFILLYFPCIATFVAIRNEAGGWKWAILTAVYTIILAWVMAFITYNLASLFL